MLARSKAGHDKDCIYVITDVTKEYVYLADGEARTLLRPKKKNRKHVQPIRVRENGCPSDDGTVRERISKYAQRAGKA